MRIARTISELRVPGDSSRPGSARRVLVPTMGALHEGHLQLVREARKLAGQDGEVVVSVFVNPAQFDRTSDYNSYPRDLDDDAAKCEREGVDIVFSPEPQEMYAPDHSVQIEENLLTKHLCGATRPGHFEGVCLVVAKLFNAVGCQAAVFGKKDYQQLAVIRRLVRDLNMPVEVVGVETVREADGLAMSSRNLLLTMEARAQASVVRRALLAMAAAFREGTRRSSRLKELAEKELEGASLARIDYLEIVDAGDLQLVDELTGPSVAAAAVFFGDVRLIDNLELSPPP